MGSDQKQSDGPEMVSTSTVCRYHKIIDAIEAAGMVPNATLHHFVHPDWWDRMGGFEKAKNIPMFTDFCVLCVREFGQRIRLWATFNEPTCALVCGWLIGAHTPGKLMSLFLMGRVRFVLCSLRLLFCS